MMIEHEQEMGFLAPGPCSFFYMVVSPMHRTEQSAASESSSLI